MKYLIYTTSGPFYSNHFDVDNHYTPGMVVFNLVSHEFTTDGVTWSEIPEDHL